MLTTEPEHHLATAALDASVVALPERVVVRHRGVGALFRIERLVELARQQVDTVELGAR